MILSVLHFGNLGLLITLSPNIAVDSGISNFRNKLLICPDWQERLEDLHIARYMEGFWLFWGF